MNVARALLALDPNGDPLAIAERAAAVLRA